MKPRVASLLKQARKQNYFSIISVARISRISPTSLRMFEKDTLLPTDANLETLAKIYQLNVDHFKNTDHITVATINPENKFAKNLYNTLNIMAIIFSFFGLPLLLLGISLYFCYAFPEYLDERFSKNENYSLIEATVTHYVISDISKNNKPLYRIKYEWTKNNNTYYGYSTPVYEFSQAFALSNTTIYIRVHNERAVIVPYVRSIYSELGWIFLGTFGMIGVLFLTAGGVVFCLNKKYY